VARPPALDPLFRSLRSFKGVGPQLGALLNRYFGSDEHEAVALDLLMHMPVGTIDRRRMDGVAHTFVGHQATLKLHIDRHEPVPRNMPTRPHRVFAHDETGEIQLVFFRATGGWVEKLLPVGEERYVAGTIGFFQGMKQITHPDYVLEVDKFAAMPLVEPVYPLTQGLTSKALIKLVREVLATLPELPEWIVAERMEQFRWPSFHAAMSKVHAPEEPGDSELWSPARMRLAYDEYLAGQLALLIVRSTLISPRGIARSFTGEITGRVIQSLPFALTVGQQMAVDDIRADLAAPTRMSRLLQGDVGAGKTVVALMAMAAVAESGAQSALMSPTELLAAQHYRTLQPLAEAAGLRVALLTGKQTAAERRAILGGIADGSTHIVVGTHALFQSQVEFHNLGLTVVDEQHRFGVEQRLALSDKGKHADLLVMTATPIPRTLVLTHIGDMAVSILR
jgi:ATP-dependent DNA helicase RecG